MQMIYNLVFNHQKGGFFLQKIDFDFCERVKFIYKNYEILYNKLGVLYEKRTVNF